MNNPDTEIIICGGNAKPEDTHLASIVRCVDEEVFDFLKRREQRKRHACRSSSARRGDHHQVT
jgi:hypothetical protein